MSNEFNECMKKMTNNMKIESPYERHNITMMCKDIVKDSNYKNEDKYIKYIMICLLLFVIIYLYSALFSEYELLNIKIPDYLSNISNNSD